VTATDLSWLVARPIAHRGLHDAARGVVENSRAAARAACDRGYAIECDVQLSADGEAFVFHDDTLERLTATVGDFGAASARELKETALRGSSETIPTLAEFLQVVAARTPLVIELKSRFDGDVRVARRAAEILANYRGKFVVECFDPDPIAFLRAEGRGLGMADAPLGMVAQAAYDAEEWPAVSAERRGELASWTHFSRTRPQFVSFEIDDLPHPAASILRAGLGAPVTAWTVRSPADAKAAAPWIDQIVFEGFAA